MLHHSPCVGRELAEVPSQGGDCFQVLGPGIDWLVGQGSHLILARHMLESRAYWKPRARNGVSYYKVLYAVPASTCDTPNTGSIACRSLYRYRRHIGK